MTETLKCPDCGSPESNESPGCYCCGSEVTVGKYQSGRCKDNQIAQLKREASLSEQRRVLMEDLGKVNDKLRERVRELERELEEKDQSWLDTLKGRGPND